MFQSPKGLNYRIFKNDFCLEHYLNDLSFKDAVKLCKFRTCNINLPIEKGRWLNIPRNERKCTLCNSDEIGDEFHYLFNCKDIIISSKRKTCLSKYYCENPNTFKFDSLFNSKNRNILMKIVKFINVIDERVTSPG